MNKVTAATLAQIGACPKFIEIFKQLWPKGATWETPLGLQRIVNRAARAGLAVDWAAGRLKLTVTITEYWANGNKCFQVRRINGLRQGAYLCWDEYKKTLRIKGWYVNGVPYGKWIYYDVVNKRIAYVDEYKNGRILTRRNRYGEKLYLHSGRFGT